MWGIVRISTGQVVERGIESRSRANSRRWLEYESGGADDPGYEEEYGVCRLDG